MPVDLPLGQHRRVARAAPRAQSANFGSRPSSPRELAPLRRPRARAAPRPRRRRSPPRGAPPRASRTCASRATSTASRPRRSSMSRAVGVRPSSSPSARSTLEQLLARREAPRHEARGPLGGVPGAEVLDHRLRMHARLRVGRELLHRRRAAEPGGATRAAPRGSARRCSGLPDPGLERRQLVGIDRVDRVVRRFPAMQEW